jgi:hypothetical protein
MLRCLIFKSDQVDHALLTFGALAHRHTEAVVDILVNTSVKGTVRFVMAP